MDMFISPKDDIRRYKQKTFRTTCAYIFIKTPFYKDRKLKILVNTLRVYRG